MFAPQLFNSQLWPRTLFAAFLSVRGYPFASRLFAPRLFPPRLFGQVFSGGFYRIYQRDAIDGTETLVAQVPAGTAQVDLSGFTADQRAWFIVRAVSPCGVEDTRPARLLAAEFDGDAMLRASVPNAPSGLALARRAGGVVVATWYYNAAGQRIAPDSFKVHVAEGESAALALDQSIAALGGLSQRFSATLGPFAAGQLVRVVVRSASAAGDMERNQIEASIRADSTAPNGPREVVIGVTRE